MHLRDDVGRRGPPTQCTKRAYKRHVAPCETDQLFSQIVPRSSSPIGFNVHYLDSMVTRIGIGPGSAGDVKIRMVSAIDGPRRSLIKTPSFDTEPLQSKRMWISWTRHRGFAIWWRTSAVADIRSRQPLAQLHERRTRIQSGQRGIGLVSSSDEPGSHNAQSRSPGSLRPDGSNELISRCPFESGMDARLSRDT